MKKWHIVLLSLVAFLFLGSCFMCCLPKFGYEFRQEYDQIVRIEILEKMQYTSGYDPNKVEVLKTLDITEHRTFIDDLMKVDCVRVYYDPPLGFGDHIIRITYRNGEKELISVYNSGYVSVEGTVTEDYHMMDNDQFYDLLSGILGEQLSPKDWNETPIVPSDTVPKHTEHSGTGDGSLS